MSDFFSTTTIAKLNAELSKDDVKTRKGSGTQQLSYIPSFHAINEANRIFGFGNWSTEIMHLHQIDKSIYEKPGYKPNDPPKEMISISYLCHLKLVVTNGDREAYHEDTGFGNGVAGNSAHGIGSCIELASKEAVTDALKRCLRYYGNKFGLSLYDKDVELMGSNDIEAAKIVTETQLNDLRDLYSRRGINDKWVLTAIKSEGYPHDTLELMRNDWWQRAYLLAENHKRDDIEREDYEKEVDNAIEMMAESANMNMLKALFSEVWQKSQKYDDKERQIKSKTVYDEVKQRLEK